MDYYFTHHFLFQASPIPFTFEGASPLLCISSPQERKKLEIAEPRFLLCSGKAGRRLSSLMPTTLNAGRHSKGESESFGVPVFPLVYSLNIPVFSSQKFFFQNKMITFASLSHFKYTVLWQDQSKKLLSCMVRTQDVLRLECRNIAAYRLKNGHA